MTKSTAVAEVTPTDLRTMVQRPSGPTEIAPSVLARIADYMSDAPILSGTMSDMLTRVMDCETLEDAATLFSGLDSTEDVAGVPLMIRSFALNESSFDNPAALPFYALVFATNRDTGAEIQFNTGSTSILVTLLTAHRREWFPFTAHIVAVPLDDGNTAYNMVFDA